MKTLLATIVLLASLPLPVFASSILSNLTNTTEFAVADTYISKALPSSNFGKSSLLLARRFTANDSANLHKVIFFVFDLTDSNYVGQEITKAQLKFTVAKTHSSHKSVRIMPYTGWDENSANYNSFNEPNGGQSITPFSYPILATFKTDVAGITVDLTEDIKPLLGTKFVVVLEDQGAFDLTVYSKENLLGKGKPRIEMSMQPKITTGNPSGQALTPTVLSFSNNEIISPMRGLYSWMGNDGKFNPNSEPPLDKYKRFEWKQLETSKNVYNFDVINNEINRLKPGQKFAFRIRAMTDSNNALPAYMQASPYTFTCDGQKLPNWNNPEYIERARLLMEKLGEKYNNSGKIAFVDIGMYGKFGEGHMNGMSDACQGSDATKRKFIDMHVQYFSNLQLVMLYGNDEADYALATVQKNSYGPIGLRSDTIGEKELTFMSNMTKNYTLLRETIDVWKTAPFITEFVGVGRINKATGFHTATMETTAWHFSALSNGNTHEWSTLATSEREDFNDLAKTLGYRYYPERVTFNGTVAGGTSFKIITDWSNVGVAPTYEPWKVNYILRKSGSSTTAATFTSNIDLRSVLPTTNRITGNNAPKRYSDSFTMPGSLQGNYDVYVFIEDARSGYRRLPLQLALSGRNSKGEYKIGTITVD